VRLAPVFLVGVEKVLEGFDGSSEGIKPYCVVNIVPFFFSIWKEDLKW